LFACIVSVHRGFILRGQTFRAAFALPVLWTAVEYLSEFRSPHSTWGNLAYTQLDCLPLIQIASITGIWSISFVVLLFPSTIAVMLAPRSLTLTRKPAYQPTLAVAGAIFIVVFGYGFYRLATAPTSPRVTVALISTDRKLSAQGPATVDLVRAYVAQIPGLASQGAKVVVFPEKIGHIKGDDLAQADAILEQAARDNRVTIFVSFEHQPNLHEARLYSPDGRLEGTYEKHHMLPRFESHLLPGTARLTFDRPSDDGSEGKWGVEICKDMDFPLLSRQYANDGAQLMLVPAWDFIADGWLHGRMAIFRGVESGFSIARSVKQGILSLSDSRGRVLAQRVTGSGTFDTIVGDVPLGSGATFYDRTGNWFAWVDLVFAALLFVPARHKRSLEDLHGHLCPAGASKQANERLRPLICNAVKLVVISERICPATMIRPLPTALNRAMLDTPCWRPYERFQVS
ncbi:MAG TPA: nitrilase-related carbon-nitrogen hydrolase, partial [Silvibacterium sp.]|nr:nitrilase-related carbon-nitrogen hydrolase [Silvibacterium sp.]